MSVYVTEDTRVIVQGITGSQGAFHTKLMKEFGTNIVAGVTPGKGGEKVEGIPVYNSVKEALSEHKADWSCVFVPAQFAKKAVMEALENRLNVAVITEGIPIHDTLEFVTFAEKEGLRVIGPNCPGITAVGKSKLGIMPNHLFKKGKVGIVSRSGTLTYEIISLLSNAGIGQSTCIGIGGDPIIGTTFLEALLAFERDNSTEQIVLVGEIGGDLEEQVASYMEKHVFEKPVIAYIAGRTAPKGKKMGHAGAVISGSSGTWEAKVQALERVGVKVARLPSEIPLLLKA